MLASLLVSAEGRQGTFSLFMYVNGMSAPTTDLCSAEVNALVRGIVTDPAGPEPPCEVVMVGGVPIRITIEHDAERGEIKHATRFLQGGVLTVTSDQGVQHHVPDGKLPPDAVHEPSFDFDHTPPLAAPVFTSEQLAAIAADPDLLP